MIYWIIIALIIYWLVKRSGRRNAGGSGTSAAGTAGTVRRNRPAILDYVTQVPILSFENGVIFLENSVYGHYDAQGRVFNREGKYIGMSYPGGGVIMDRTYNYDWLRGNLPTDRSVQDPNCRPAMTMLAGENNYSYIEAPEGMENVFISQGCTDPTGAGAAYLVAVNDGLINLNMSRFYYAQSVQEDVYFIARNGRGMAYSDYFKRTYGQPFFSLG